ncbi:serine protease [Arthrobacter sp. NPDC056886]|uniref:S1 family peptidase n=1 Tax=Arthrobacter sp. NPDC056886 TaxID=3345960 RepID=UPI003672844F
MEANTLYKDLMFTVLRIVTTDENGHGDGNRGTCVMVDLELTPETTTPVLVTNKHVVERAGEISLHVQTRNIHGNVILGDTVPVKITLEGDRFFSPQGGDVDIAIIPFGQVLLNFKDQYPDREPFWRCLPVSEFPSNDEYASLDALEEVFFIGHPDGRWDKVNRTPIFRRGITATPAILNWEGRSEFLIDASVFPGSSGSPVFVSRTTTFLQNSKLIKEQLAIFAGLVTESHHRKHDFEVLELPYEIEESIDLGVVTNVTAIKRALDSYCEYANQPKPKFRDSALGASK